MAVQASAQASRWWGNGTWCALALALGCAPRVASSPVEEPRVAREPANSSIARDDGAAATPSAASDPFFLGNPTVHYWMQKDHPSRPCPDANVGTELCLLMTFDAVNPRGPRPTWREERPSPAAEPLVRASEG